MAEVLGATNPVPGYDNAVTNRNLPVSPENTQIQNVADPNRVIRPDGRTEQQDSGALSDGKIRYDSNFQTFLQRLKEAPGMLESLSGLFRMGTVVSSGMSEGIAADMSKILQMLQMDEGQLLQFLTEQFKTGSRYKGVLFALLRNAYKRAASEGVQADILQFLKSYADYSSTAHLEANLLRNLRGMADAMPKSWAQRLLELTAQLENGIAAGDRAGNLALLRQQVFPHMANYVNQTHDMGTARMLLSLLTLDMARYENGSEENLLQAFHRLTGYGTLKDQLGKIDDKSLLALFRRSQFDQSSAAVEYANHLADAAARALRGEGDAQVQEMFQQLVKAMLVNESVYMPLNHYLIPMELDGRMLFSELWVDPDADEDQNKEGAQQGGAAKLLLKMDIQSLGLFDIVLLAKEREVEMQISCPEKVAAFSKRIEQGVSEILTRNGLTPTKVVARQMMRPLTITEVFPKIFEGKNSVDVKV
jgi:hypothetical protein